MSVAQNFPHGSAHFADERSIRRAFKARGGIPIGFHKGRLLTHAGRASSLLVSGSGAGKWTTVLSHMMRAKGGGGEPLRVLWFCPKGEALDVIGPGLVHMGAHVFSIDPWGISRHCGHSVSLLSHLKAGSSTLVADTRLAARTLLPEAVDEGTKFFDQSGQEWFAGIMQGLAHADGEVSFQSLYSLMSMVRSDPEAWEMRAQEIAASAPMSVETTLRQMIVMAEESPRTFDSIFAGMQNAIAWMSDPALQETLADEASAEFSLDVLIQDTDRPVFVFISCPPQLIAQNQAFIRMCLSTLRILKQRKPSAPTVTAIIDECASLGRFPDIAELFAIGRGFGISVLPVYQDLGQIRHNLGPTGAMTLSANAEVEMYLGGGISDLHTAEHLSRRLGNQTLVLDEPLIQARAVKAKRAAVHRMLFEGADPIKTGMEMAHLDFEMAHVKKQSRALMNPDEILNMPPGKALVLASSHNIGPMVLDKVPYYQRPEYAGCYFPNPYFDTSMDRVRVQTRLGKRWCTVIEEPVPPEFEEFPQYQHGTWRFIEGYRPKPQSNFKRSFLRCIARR